MCSVCDVSLYVHTFNEFYVCSMFEAVCLVGDGAVGAVDCE